MLTHLYFSCQKLPSHEYLERIVSKRLAVNDKEILRVFQQPPPPQKKKTKQ